MAKLHPIEVLIRAEKWLAARKAIQAELKSSPDDHWLLTRLGLTYYEMRDYATALFYEEQALGIAPRCPLVLWDYAGSLQMLGRDQEAIEVYRRLVRRGPKRIAAGPCGEGLARARGLVADCHYRIAESLEELGLHDEALREFEKHLGMRGRGGQSIYSRGELVRPGETRSERKPTT